MLEGRAAQFAAEVGRPRARCRRGPLAQVGAAIDRWVWYAGWADKVAQIAGSANPVAGPYFNFSVPEPTGVVAVLAPAGSSLLGLVSVLAPVIATGNTAVVVASSAAAAGGHPDRGAGHLRRPRRVVNMLTGPLTELAPVLAGHRDVNAIDLTGAPRQRAAITAGCPPTT